MKIQIGKNPEFTFSVCFSCAWWGGEIALPLKLSWWNHNGVGNNKNREISISILCFRFGLEIWFWEKK